MADELGRKRRTVQDYVRQKVADADKCRVRTGHGGDPAIWVSPTAVVSLKAAYGSSAVEEGATATTTTPQVLPPAVEAPTPGQPIPPPVEVATATTPLVVAPAGVGGVDSAGWQVAVDQAERRANEHQAEAERLRRESEALRERMAETERRAEEAERARSAYAEMLAEERAAWWQWVAYIKGLGFFRRLAGIPEPPQELASGKKRLMPPKG